MTQPDRHRKGIILIALAISLLFCLRFSLPPLTSHQPLSITTAQPAWIGNTFRPDQSLSTRSLQQQ